MKKNKVANTQNVPFQENRFGAKGKRTYKPPKIPCHRTFKSNRSINQVLHWRSRCHGSRVCPPLEENKRKKRQRKNFNGTGPGNGSRKWKKQKPHGSGRKRKIKSWKPLVRVGEGVGKNVDDRTRKLQNFKKKKASRGREPSHQTP